MSLEDENAKASIRLKNTILILVCVVFLGPPLVCVGGMLVVGVVGTIGTTAVSVSKSRHDIEKSNRQTEQMRQRIEAQRKEREQKTR